MLAVLASSWSQGDFGISMHPVLILWPHCGQGRGLASGHCLLSALLHGQVGLRPDGQHSRPYSCASRISSQHHGGLIGGHKDVHLMEEITGFWA